MGNSQVDLGQGDHGEQRRRAAGQDQVAALPVGGELRLEMGEPPVAVVVPAAPVEVGTGAAGHPAVGSVTEALPKGHSAERHPPQAETPSRLDGGHDAEVHGAMGCVGPPSREILGKAVVAHPDPRAEGVKATLPVAGDRVPGLGVDGLAETA